MAVPLSAEAEIARRMKEALVRWCITDAEAADQSRANHVIIGKPTNELADEIVISVHTQHPLGPQADKDGVVMGPPREQDERPWRFPQETDGGMRSEKIVGAVQVNIREDLPADDAIKVSSMVVERVKAALNRDYRLRAFLIEEPIKTFVSRIESFESRGYAAGGGDVSIYIRWVGWRALVHYTNVRETEGVAT